MKKLLLLMLITIQVKAQVYPEFVQVSAGNFKMGSNKWDLSMPIRMVNLEAFSISINPVTVEQWAYYCQETNKPMPQAPKWGWQKDHPIVNISWYEAAEYAEWLGKQLDKKVRLPYEKEWEYAARSKHPFSGGKNWEKVAWFNSASTQAVKTKAPNALGIYDLSGNVWEWCFDWFGLYADKPNRMGTFKVLRGGSWYNLPVDIRQRERLLPTTQRDYIGFRVVME